jgi:hypothetical protein
MSILKRYNTDTSQWEAIDSGAINDGSLRITPNQFGILSNLTTTEKTNLVGAVSEVKDEVGEHKADNTAHGLGNHITDSAIFAKAKGLKGDGGTDDYSALNALLTEIGTNKREIYFSPGTYVIGTNITIPENIKLIFANGAMLSPLSGVTVTINGIIDAGLHQIFTDAGIITGAAKVKNVIPQWFGAKGDNSTICTSAFRKAVTLAMSSGVTFKIPPGIYKIDQQILIDNSSSTHFLDTKKINIKGAGLQSTRIIYTGVGSCFKIISGNTTTYNAQQSLQKISDFTIIGTNIENSMAFHLVGCQMLKFDHVDINSFDYGVYGENLDFINFSKCFIHWNKRGAYFTITYPAPTATAPNSINFFDCHIGGNGIYGIFSLKGCCINFYGGDVEGNGSDTGSPLARGGILLYDGCSQGGVGCNLDGVYFEANQGLGDVVIVNENAPVAPFELNEGVYNIRGCSFNRASADKYCTYNIFVHFDSAKSGQQKIIVTGCGFKNYSAYTPDAARPHIGFTQNARSASNCYFKGNVQTNDIENVMED